MSRGDRKGGIEGKCHEVVRTGRATSKACLGKAFAFGKRSPLLEAAEAAFYVK